MPSCMQVHLVEALETLAAWEVTSAAVSAEQRSSQQAIITHTRELCFQYYTQTGALPNFSRNLCVRAAQLTLQHSALEDVKHVSKVILWEWHPVLKQT